MYRPSLLIVIYECPTLSIRVCFGQVCLSPAKTYFSNYYSPPPAALPSPLWKSFPPLLSQPPLSEALALPRPSVPLRPSRSLFCLVLSLRHRNFLLCSRGRFFDPILRLSINLVSPSRRTLMTLPRTVDQFYRDVMEMTVLSLSLSFP